MNDLNNVDLTNLSNKEICEFLLNGKKADALHLNAERTEDNESGFVNHTIYKDKNIEIIFNYLKKEGSVMIQNFTIYSKWWGKIKNSFFTLEGFKGKTNKIKCGVISIDELEPYNFKGSQVRINNKNAVAEIEITDFASLGLYSQRKYKASPSYKVIEVISESPNTWVKIEINMPDGETYFAEGISKKDAANRFAAFFKENML